MARLVVGMISGDPGTLLGPTDITKEWLVILDDGESVGYATEAEINTAIGRILSGNVQSLTEYKMWEEYNRGTRSRTSLGSIR